LEIAVVLAILAIWVEDDTAVVFLTYSRTQRRFHRPRESGRKVFMRGEKIDRLIQNCFGAREMAFLVGNAAFKNMLEAVDDLDDFEKLAKLGAILLAEVEFPNDAGGRPGAKSG
jgi:hypothetical protein